MGENIEILDTINRAKQGDLAAFERLIQNHEATVYQIACQMMNHSEDAKDVSQEVFIKVYKNLKNFDGKSAFTTWLYRITVNTCIDEMRKRKNKQTVSMEAEQEMENGVILKQYEDNGKTPEEDLIAKEDCILLHKAMTQLSQEHSTILTLRDIQGFSYDEIAEILTISMGTVKSRLARARMQLKKEFLNLSEQNGNGVRLSKRKEETAHEL